MVARRPSIFQIGRVDFFGDVVSITGWGLGLCMWRCPCHRHPTGGFLTVVEDDVVGTLGLRRYRPCGCCEAWTVDELTAVLGFLRDLDHVPTAKEGTDA